MPILQKDSETNDGFRYALVRVDVFSQYGWAVTVKTKTPKHVIIAFEEITDNIVTPKTLESDSEGALLSNEFIIIHNKHHIKHITLVQKAPYIEVSIRTLKQMVYNR